MVDFRACPKCHGDLYTARDMYGGYKECLQCGYMLDIRRPDQRDNGLGDKRKARGNRKAA